jgi:hypothetical protein
VAPAPQPFVSTPQRIADTQTDPRFGSCKEANANGFGNYPETEPEYDWYQDRDRDGVVCEFD